MLSQFEEQINADIYAYLMNDIRNSITLYAQRTGKTYQDAVKDVTLELAGEWFHSTYDNVKSVS